MNAVYKKDARSDSGSLSPGLSQDDADESSLIDLYIANSKPSLQQQRTSNTIQHDSARQFQRDEHYLQPDQFSSNRQLSKKSSNRNSGSFAQLQKEKAAQKQQSIDNFMARQDKFERKKERNLKKLTKDVHKRETSVKTPRQGSQTARKTARGGQKKTGNIPYDSFEGVKDGVANKMHCDPHSTSSNLALQTISFPGANPTVPSIDGMNQQYINMMNTHPLLQNTLSNPQQQVSNGSLYQQQVQVMQNFHPQQQHVPTTQADYYQTMIPIAGSAEGLPKPYTQHNRNLTASGRPLPPHMMASQSAAMAAAVTGEEVLDEFPVPANVHIAPKMTDISLEQKSFLQMQNAINQSSRILGDELGHPSLNQQNQDSQNVTNIMMQALGGQDFNPQTNYAHLQDQGYQVPVQVEKFFGAPVHHQKQVDLPSRIGSRLPSYQISHSQIPPVASQAHLETTQIMKVGSVGKHPSMMHSHQPSNPNISQHQMQQYNYNSANQQVMMLQNALGNDQQQPFIGKGNQIAKDIDILDSEFAQEESRQIEAYYMSVNKESNEQLKSSRSSMHKPRKSSIRSNKRSHNKRMMSPPAKGYSQTGQNRSMTEKKLISGVRVGVSRLDQGSQNADNSENKSQVSRSSQKSARRVNAKAVAQAREHIQMMQIQRRQKEAQKALQQHKQQVVKVQAKVMRDELYLSNKLTRQFIMVTSLVMQSEDLSEDSIFNYAQYTEFAIRFGLMSERAASEESDERALLYEMWCTLSRVHSDFAFVRVVNLKTMITAILGFPIALHRNPIEIREKKRAQRMRQKLQEKLERQKQMEIQEEEEEFKDADCDDVPTENNFKDSLQGFQASRQPLNIERSAGKVSRSTQQTHQSHESINIRMQGSSNMFTTGQQNRPGSIIDEYDELRAAENGQLSSPEMSQPRRGNQQQRPHQASQAQNEEDEDADSEEQQYFFDQQMNAAQQQDANDYSNEDNGEGSDEDEENANEYAIDRAHKIGFFMDHFEFCMSQKDVKTVQRRFTLFKRNWSEFQKKDLVVKKSVIVDDGVTFKPKINKKSELMILEKEMGSNLEFPISNNTRSDQRSQRRQKIWERDLPRGVKSKERIYSIEEVSDLDRGQWLTRTENQVTSKGLSLYQNANSRDAQTRDNIGAHRSNTNNHDDYFALGGTNGNQNQFNTFASVVTSQKSQTSRQSGPKQLTSPRMTHRMEQVYQIGKAKMLSRQDADQNSIDYEKSIEQCTFKPKISKSSRKLSTQSRNMSEESRPWAKTSQQEKPSGMKSAASQQQLAERMQLSIQKDIARRKQAQVQKQIKEKVMNKGGWPKDYERQLQQQEQQADEEVRASFKNYFHKKQPPQMTPKQTKKDSAMVRSLKQRAESEEQLSSQKFPLTANTSRQNLPPQQNTFAQDQNQVDYSELSTPVNEFNLAGATQKPTQQIVTTTSQPLSHNSRQPSTGLVREQTPNRGMGAAMQHSTDEQGRAPLESQSSLSKTNERSLGQSVSEEGGNQLTNITTPSHAQMLQKAVEDLTVIQETTFEQTNKAGIAMSEFGGASSSLTRKPLLFIEVDTNGAEDGGIERIEVFKGDDPRQLAADFCRKHDYDEGTQIVLHRQIEEKLARAYAKLDAKMQEKRQNRLAEKFRARQAQRASQ